MQRIQPKVLKGFRDILPTDEMKRKKLIRKLEERFALFGYKPIDTPALEYTEILLGKGGGETEKQIFRFQDQGGRDVALRFDLTVPFARFMAQHGNTLPLPFKRYHIGKAWRGEKPQKGRFREFYQCDCDIVGVDSASADIEIISVMVESLQALDINEFTIHFSHRGLFNRFLQTLGDAETQEAILRAVDKLHKIGLAKVEQELTQLVGSDKALLICQWITAQDSFEKTLENLEKLSGGVSEESTRLRAIYKGLTAMGCNSVIQLDPSITRGLDYYTGVVFETFLDKLPEIGSICSGGRYNNLAALYTKQELPGVGCSIGLDRTIAALDQLQPYATEHTEAAVLVCNPEDAHLLAKAHRVAHRLRAGNVSAEVYHKKKKYGAQFKYAQERGMTHAIILSCEAGGVKAASAEAKGSAPQAKTQETLQITIKNIDTRESFDCASVTEALTWLHKDSFKATSKDTATNPLENNTTEKTQNTKGTL